MDKKAAKFWYNKGVDFTESFEYEKALQAYNKGLEFDASDPDIWNNKCYVLTKLGKYEDAIKAGNVAVGLEPNDPTIWDTLCDAYMAVNNQEKVTECKKHVDSKQQEPVEISSKKDPKLPAPKKIPSPKKRSLLKWIGIIFGGVILIFVLFAIISVIFMPNINNPTPQTKCILSSNFDDSTGNAITQLYPYVVNGEKGTVKLTLNNQLNNYFSCRSMEIGRSRTENTSVCKSFLFFRDCKTSNITVERPLELINENKKYSALKPLADAIKSISNDPNMQARIAINLVQHIPYNCLKSEEIDDSKYQGSSLFSSPYTVLYENTGICSEKSALLAALLNELGYESAYIDFDKDLHTMAGIGGSGSDQYQNTGFILIESTNPNPIGYIPNVIQHPLTNVWKLSGGTQFTLNNQDRLDSKKVYQTDDQNQRYGYQTKCS